MQEQEEDKTTAKWATADQQGCPKGSAAPIEAAAVAVAVAAAGEAVATAAKAEVEGVEEAVAVPLVAVAASDAADADATGTGLASPAVLRASFFLRACALQALGAADLALEEESVPSVSASAVAAQLALHLAVPAPTPAHLLAAGCALQALLQQQPPPPPPSPAAVFQAPYSPALAALPPASLTALLRLCDLAGLPAPTTTLVTASLAQRYASQPASAFQAQLAAPCPRSAALVAQWWRASFGSPNQQAAHTPPCPCPTARDWALSSLPFADTLPPIALGLDPGAAREELWVRGLELECDNPPPHAALLALAFGQQAWLQRHSPALLPAAARSVEVRQRHLGVRAACLAHALLARPLHLAVALHCLGGVQHLTLTDSGWEAWVRNWGLEALQAVPGAFPVPACAELAQGWCQALAAVLQGGQLARGGAYAGCIEALAALLQAHAQQAAVALPAARAFMLLSQFDGGVPGLLERSGSAAALSAALALHPALPELAQPAMAVLALLAAHPSAARAACLEAGAAGACVQALLACGGCEGVVAAGGLALSALAVDGPGRAACLAAGAAQAVLAALQGTAGQGERAASSCCEAVAVLWERGPEKKEVGEGGPWGACISAHTLAAAASAVLAAMLAHPASAELQRTGCQACASLAQWEAGLLACITAGAAPVLVAVLLAHAHSSAAVQQGCSAVSRLCREHAGLEACLAAGAAPAVVGVLEGGTAAAAAAASEDLDVEAARLAARLAASEALGALMALAQWRTGSTACREAGALRAVMGALQAHWGTGLARLSSCALLAVLGRCWDEFQGMGGAVLAALVLDAGCCSATARHCFSVLARVSRECCREVHGSYKNGPVLVTAWGAAALVGALTAHLSCQHTAELGCQALAGVMSCEPWSSRTLALQAGALGALLAAAHAHPASAACATHLLVSLQGLGARCEGKRACAAAAGCVAALVSALAAHAGCVQAARAGCRALAAWARGLEGRESVVCRQWRGEEGGLQLQQQCLAAGAVGAVCAVLAAQGSDREAVEAACQALRGLALGEEGRAVCAAQGGAAGVAAALGGQAARVDSVRAGLRALMDVL